MHTPNQVSHFSQLDAMSRFPAHVDLFLCCASFEKRSATVACSLDAESIARTLILRNPVLKEFVNPQLDSIRHHLTGNSLVIDWHVSHPVATEDKIQKVLGETLNPSMSGRSILIDITTFTREVLLILLNNIRHYISDRDTIMLAYTSAEGYGGWHCRSELAETNSDEISLQSEQTEQDEEPKEEFWLSKGVRDIRSVIGYPGEILPSRPIHLIVLSGYESERAALLIDQYEPRYLSLGLGMKGDSVSDLHYEHNLRFYKEINSLYGNVENFTFSPTNPFATRDAISRQAKLHPEANVVVAPLNTKIATVGAGLAAIMNPTIQLCYAQGDIYNYHHYSDPGDIYVFYIALSDVSPGQDFDVL